MRVSSEPEASGASRAQRAGTGVVAAALLLAGSQLASRVLGYVREIVLAQRTLHVTPSTGRVFEEGQRPRLLLRVANWLHLNRGKKAWTYVADTYAAGLLLLALSGMLMLPGRKGLFGRGGLLVLLGAAIPILYVQLSGGP